MNGNGNREFLGQLASNKWFGRAEFGAKNKTAHIHDLAKSDIWRRQWKDISAETELLPTDELCITHTLQNVAFNSIADHRYASPFLGNLFSVLFNDGFDFTDNHLENHAKIKSHRHMEPIHLKGKCVRCFTFFSFLVLMSTSCWRELYVSLSSSVSSSRQSISCCISRSRLFCLHKQAHSVSKGPSCVA